MSLMVWKIDQIIKCIDERKFDEMMTKARK